MWWRIVTYGGACRRRFEGHAALGGPPWAAPMSAPRKGASARSTACTSSSATSADASAAAARRAARWARVPSLGARKSMPNSICGAHRRAGGVGIHSGPRGQGGPVGRVGGVGRVGRGRVGVGECARARVAYGCRGEVVGSQQHRLCRPAMLAGCALLDCPATASSPTAAEPASRPSAARWTSASGVRVW